MTSTVGDATVGRGRGRGGRLVVAMVLAASALVLPGTLEARRLERRATAVQATLASRGVDRPRERSEGSAGEVFEWIRGIERRPPQGRTTLRLEVSMREEGGPWLVAEVLGDEALRREEQR